MSLLFSDLNISNNGDNLVTYGSKLDVCLFSLREQMKGKPSSELVKVRKELEGQLEGVPVVKFRHSGAEIVLSLEYIHKLAERNPLKEKNTATEAETSEEVEAEKSE